MLELAEAAARTAAEASEEEGLALLLLAEHADRCWAEVCGRPPTSWLTPRWGRVRRHMDPNCHFGGWGGLQPQQLQQCVRQVGRWKLAGAQVQGAEWT